MKYLLGVKEITAILDHWQNTPVNAYRGSSYGEDHNKLLLQTMSEDIADDYLSKLKRDIPLLANLDSDTLSILSEDIGHDTKRIYLSVGSVLLPIATADTSNYQGETFYANAQ
jgi:hypothetical protein